MFTQAAEEVRLSASTNSKELFITTHTEKPFPKWPPLASRPTVNNIPHNFRKTERHTLTTLSRV